MQKSSDTAANDCLQQLLVAAGGERQRLRFVLVANVNALLHYYQDSEFRRCFQSAEVVLTADRFSGWVMRCLSGIRVPMCSRDSMLRRIRAVVRATDRILWIGDAAPVPEPLRARVVRCLYLDAGTDSLGNVAACVSFIEGQAPFRFCVLAMASPQRELIAHTLLRRARVAGLILCM